MQIVPKCVCGLPYSWLGLEGTPSSSPFPRQFATSPENFLGVSKITLSVYHHTTLKSSHTCGEALPMRHMQGALFGVLLGRAASLSKLEASLNSESQLKNGNEHFSPLRLSLRWFAGFVEALLKHAGIQDIVISRSLWIRHLKVGVYVSLVYGVCQASAHPDNIDDSWGYWDAPGCLRHTWGWQFWYRTYCSVTCETTAVGLVAP